VGETVRTCFVCKVEKPITEFGETTRPGAESGRRFSCKACNEDSEIKTTSGGGVPRTCRRPTKPRGRKWVDYKGDAELDTRPTADGTPRALVINTYGGSLLIGAARAGVEVIASLEDSGYGTQHQHANFPELRDRIIGGRTNWPTLDLEEAIVIGHPPCAAFSQVNTSAKTEGARGIGAAKFKCTVDVLTYAMTARAKVIMVESVVRTMEGARTVHDRLAGEHGYDVYRVLQAAADFGVPQKRNRFWCIFVRQDAGFKPWFKLPDYPAKRLCEILELGDDGPFLGMPKVQKLVDDLPRQFTEAGLTNAQIEEVFRGEHGYGRTFRLACRVLDLPGTIETRSQLSPIFGKYESAQVSILDPEGLAPTVMGGASWMCAGRALMAVEYKRIMGYPDDYQLPDDPREWLSRGVVPEVAAWLLSHAIQWGRGMADEDAVHLNPGDVLNVSELRNPQPVCDGQGAERKTVPKTRTTVPKTRTPGQLKRRVIRRYAFALGTVPEEEVRAAFEPKKQLVCHPLVSLEERASGFAAVLQYEPPNKGGHKGDVERIAQRAAKRLDAAGFGPVEWRDEGPCDID
jgi:site-specific DNA-cytosine methylase